MINESLKNAFKEMWKNNLNLLDISKSDLNSHIHDDNPHNITPYKIGAADSDHTHPYAGSDSEGGSATSAVKLDSSAGSATNPIYFSEGKPAACTYTLNKSVPSDAKFTDTVYTHPTSSGNKHIPSGGSSGQILRWSADGTAVWGADKDTTYNNATTSTDGLMSSSDKTKLDDIAAGATKITVDSALSSTSTNPVQNKIIYGAISSKADLDTSGKVLSSQLPSYVDDVLEYSAKSNFPSTGESGKIYVDTATNLTYRWSGSTYVEISQSLALGETSSTAYRGDRGKIAYDHSQTTHAPTNAEVNQNAFSNVKVGSTTVSADSKTDTLELVAGTNVTLTPDATSDKVTITTNDTKNTAGSIDTSSKIFLVGATSQAANPQTYSHDTAYVGSDGCLYSNNTKVSVNGHTHTVANISDLTATATELNYCDGVTSNIQTQLNNTVKLSGDQTINGNKTFTGKIYFDDTDASIKPYLYTDYTDALKINVGGKLSWIDPDGHFHSSVDGKFIGENTLSTYGVTGVKGNAESSYRKGNVNITAANIGAAASSHTHTVANISGLTATATELNYCDGVTSNIQTQLNNTVKLSGDQTITGVKTFSNNIVANAAINVENSDLESLYLQLQTT